MSLFPTHVGMNRRCSAPERAIRPVPHARGDEPVQERTEYLLLDCSPRTWG